MSSCCLAVLAVALLAAVAEVAASKHACDFSNRLCQWPASYKFGATVLDDKAFYHGGISASDGTLVSGSAFQVLDLRTMSPSIVQVEHYSSKLNASRYGHLAVAWRDKILLVGGQQDDANGATTNVLSIIAFDVGSRTWSVLKQFNQRTAGELEFLATTVAGDQLALVFQLLDDQGNSSRALLQMDLSAPNDKSKIYNTELFSDIRMLDYPVVALLPLDDVGELVLVMHAKRELDLKDKDAMLLDLVDPAGILPLPLTHTASTSLKRLPGGTGGKVLAMKIIPLNGDPVLVAWSQTNAAFGLRSHTVNAVSVYSVIFEPGSPDEASGPSVTLKLSGMMMTLPLGVELGGVRWIDLPLLGSVQVSPSDVTVIPYIGDVDLIGEQDWSNIDIQQTDNGFVIRGSSRPSIACQRIIRWQPFVVSVDMSATPGAAQRPLVRAVSSNTWCTRTAHKVAMDIVGNSTSLESNMGLHQVGSASQPLLMVLSLGTLELAGGRFMVPDMQGPLRGAYINIQQSTVQGFNITPPEGYRFPSWVSSCTIALQGRPLYVQAGGRFFTDVGEVRLADGVVTMNAQPGKAEHSLVVAAGGGQLPARALASMACSPSGSVFYFGGAVPIAGKPNSWRATGDLFALQLQGKASAPSVRVTQLAKAGAATPPPRSGHALAYLAPGVAGLPKGGLLLYGGSNISTLPLSDVADDEEAAKVLAVSRWDTTTWLYDLSNKSWTRLATTGAALPGLMHHSMAAHGQQVMLFGGLRYDASNNTVRCSTDMFILDFAAAKPHWRLAAVSDIKLDPAQLEFPNTGITALQELGVVALMHRAGISLASTPQTLRVASLQRWGLHTLSLTAGDLVRLSPTSPGPLVVQQPLQVGSDITVTGVPATRPTQSRHSLHPSRNIQLQCGRDVSSAVTMMSSGAVLEDLHISGCNGSAVTIELDVTGASTTPPMLRNITFSGNNGTQGAAVRVAKAASAVLEGCRLVGNAATDSVLFAAEGASLNIINSTVTHNNGTAVAFAGGQLLVQGTAFAHNSAPHGRGSNGGALRLVHYEAGTQGSNSQARIVNTTFANNTAALWGGAVFMGPRTAAELVHCSFTANSASNGGAVVADRDACMASMSHVVFRGNAAQRRGGAVLMRNPSCATITWRNATFANNTAGGDGGAMCLTEMSQRNIRGLQSTFDGNKAAGSVANGGNGGALYLGLWASDVTISNTSFTRNTAAVRGGAINVLAMESSVTLDGVTASTNSVLQGVDAARVQRSAIREGGVLAVTGTDANVSINSCTMQHNAAGRGGAISVNSERGRVVIAANSSFSDNQALTAGGAVTVTERKSLVVLNSTFEGNRLLWPKLAAGGGLHCYFCESVLLRGSHFNGNKAALRRRRRRAEAGARLRCDRHAV